MFGRMAVVVHHKLSQFYVNLFLGLLKCNTQDKIMAGMENWETCVCFCSFCFPCCYCQASPQGQGIWQHICSKKIHFTSKKPTHTCNIQCVPRQKVNHNHLLSQGIFIQQPVFEEKQEYQTNFICGRFHLCTAPVVRSL